ncbi:alpha/beta hydrolase [Pseudokineococcus sp. 5B2Z-1]|uniref:alpha/beta hydrolase n=1 Tax=Pseudokineococcus sp. 5B2Z-1 TaxID=3132744 RepID=UPI0030AE9A20
MSPAPGGGLPREVDERLHPESRELLAELGAAPLPGDPAFDLARSRREVTAGAPPPTAAGARCRTRDLAVAGVPCRVYLPGGEGAPAGTVVHAHGGGFVEGDLESHDAVCREVAVASGWAVVAVDYRLAPEHPFPAALEDLEAVLAAVAAGGVGGADRVGVGVGAGVGVPAAPLALLGDSGGATLVAGACLRARRRERAGRPVPRVALQVLVYPGSGPAPASPELERGLGLSPEARDWYQAAHVPDPSQRGLEEVVPLAAASFADLPPAVVLTAELDPLRAGGEEHAARMAAAGVPVTSARLGGVVHGFWRRPATQPTARAAVDLVAGALRRAG